MKSDPRTSPAAQVGGPTDVGRAERDAAREQHAADAITNITKSRRPAEILTPDERETIERSHVGGSGTP